MPSRPLCLDDAIRLFLKNIAESNGVVKSVGNCRKSGSVVATEENCPTNKPAAYRRNTCLTRVLYFAIICLSSVQRKDKE